MRVYLNLLSAVIFLSSPGAASAAADAAPDTDVRPVIRKAKEAPMPAAGEVPMLMTRTGEDEKVWISIERPDVAALETDLLSRSPLAQNERISVYELTVPELDELSVRMQDRFRRSPGFFAHDSLASALEDLEEPPAPPARAFVIDQQEKVKPMLDMVKEESIISTIETLAAYKNRNYRSATGISSSKWLAEHWTEMAAGRPDVSVSSFKHASFPQESVILT
ncbi:MAG TPA: hypothetical protein PL037_07810, partial [Elusimicrobiales bacterium]|nr:hypothetical protein [Elusimicrobiales bacterium]